MPKLLSTYRLQFRNGMTFPRAEALVPYIKALGASHLYASPVFKATQGSTHGYDMVDPEAFDPALGGREGFLSMARALKAADLGLLLDIVPNHMAASLENTWWRDVIEWGHASRHADSFDIDWEQRLTLPFLGGDFRDVLSDGDIRLVADREHGAIALFCHGQPYPLNPGTYAALFRDMDGEPAETISLLSRQATADAEEIFHGAMRALLAGPGGAAIDRHLEHLSADIDFLDQIHGLQSFRLMNWRDAQAGLSYRRFFEIAGLVGLRIEEEAVFEKVHATIFDLVDQGLVDGLRVDHIDGLADPLGYLTRLRARIGPEQHLLVEKILGPDEALPRDWPVTGTTGYEFIRAASGLLAHHPGVEQIEKAYEALSPGSPSVEAGIREAKFLMMRENFAGEMKSLSARAHALLVRHAENPPAPEAVTRALEALLAAFSVYRTYGTAADMPADGKDRLRSIATSASASFPASDRTLLDAIVDLLNGDTQMEAAGAFRTRFQQLSGPLMAKALEDTFFYRHHSFIAFNEVGGDVMGKEITPEDFHAFVQQRQAAHPQAMNATATHDTKRGEDARARLLALSEDPGRWITGFARWNRFVKEHMSGTPHETLIETDMLWLIFQSLAGVWPGGETLPDAECLSDLSERLQAFVEKAAREAKQASNWNSVNEDYEAAHKAAIALLLDVAPHAAQFRRDFAETLKPYLRAGHLNSLVQTILKLTVPGVPDIYQGSEASDFSLVDPDNRRPRDFDRLQRHLSEVDASAELVLEDDALSKGTLKQALVSRLLHLRQRLPDLFVEGAYQPLGIEGENRGHLQAFMRQRGESRLIVAVPLKTLCLERGECIEPGEGRTRIVLPDELLHRPFLDVPTGRRISFPAGDEHVSTFAAAGFSILVDPGPELWRQGLAFR